MQFPHLSDTTFPDLNTVNVYQFRNTFDYSRWKEKTKVKLCNVLWNSEYSDVVKFDTDLERDEWFDSLDSTWTIELQQAACVVPEGYVKLPVPYDIMARFNYLFIDMPIATSTEDPIDYENPYGITRWYFFVHDIQYLSPNATQVHVIPDMWTNFQNKVDIPYMLLERGHAPVAASDTDLYLANPVANNRYLLAPDVNFDNAGITKSATFVPFGNGEKYVCFATTVSPDLIASLGSVTNSSSYNPSGTITYSDINVRYGHQLQVNGFSVGNGKDYSNANTPAKVGFSDGRIPNNLTVYAIWTEEVYGANATFFTDILNTCPQFLTTVKGCFVVDEACITLGSTYTIAGHTVFKCVGKSGTLLSKTLEKTEFKYPQELQRFAKLYTAPYAKLEITDNDGNSYDVNIEETTTLNVNYVVSIAFPYINERVYVRGIGGTGSTEYTWVDLKGNTANLHMENSDWFKYCFDWEIPTFALYMNGETAFQLESFNRNVKQAIQQSLVNYHNTMRSANTAYENACDQANVAYTNTANSATTNRTNAYNSADTGRDNAYNNADTMKTNADNSADTAYTIVDRTCTAQVANLTLQNTATAYNEEAGIVGSDTIVGYNNDLGTVTTNVANTLNQYTTDANIRRSTSSNIASNLGTVASAALQNGTTGAIMGATGAAGIGAATIAGVTIPALAVGAIGGIAIGAAGGAITAATNTLNVGYSADAAQSITDAQVAANNGLRLEANADTLLIQGVHDDVRRMVYRKNAETSVSQLQGANVASRANANDTKNTTKTNAANARTTARTNADNTRTTSRTNAGNDYDTSVTNADNTRDNIIANSGYTRQVAELNAKEILENGRYASMAAVLDARNSAPIECCSYTGNPAPDYMRTRGIQIKVKTQSDSAIRQSGAIFARYGYTLNQIWDVGTSGLKLMNHFTYWKAADIWVDDREASNNSVNTFIRNMFLNGVTVWNDPTEIGKVNVYTN